jgi:hypothetical protein
MFQQSFSRTYRLCSVLEQGRAAAGAEKAKKEGSPRMPRVALTEWVGRRDRAGDPGTT